MKLIVIILIVAASLSLVSASGNLYCKNCIAVGETVVDQADSCIGDNAYPYTAVNDSICTMRPGLGENCTVIDCSSGLICDSYSQMCIETQYKEVGEGCTKDSQCVSLNCNGTCVNPSQCTDPNQCSGGRQYCNTDTNTCVDKIPEGGNCTNAICEYGLFCTYTENVCQPLFSLANLATCTGNTQCNWTQGQICFSGQCMNLSSSSGNCSSGTSQCNYFEWCDCSTDSCQPNQILSLAAATANTDFWACMKENHCSDSIYNGINYTANSCAITKCGTYFCDILSYTNTACTGSSASNPLCALKPTTQPPATATTALSSSPQLTPTLLTLISLVTATIIYLKQ